MDTKCRQMVLYLAKEPAIEYGLTFTVNASFEPYIERAFCFDGTKLSRPI